MGNKMSPKQFPRVCDGYVKNKGTEVNRLVAVLKTNNYSDGGSCGIQEAARLGEGCLMI